MRSSTKRPANVASTDRDLAEQARPGFGIPSQDPTPAAQLPLQPREAQREAKSVLVGGGAMAGAAAGAVIGVAAGGPVGVVIGGTLGAVAGALGGEATGSLASPKDLKPTEKPLVARRTGAAR